MIENKTNKTNETNGWINWWEFSPRANIIVVRVQPMDETKLTSDTGIVLAVKQSNVSDRPYYGEVVSKGPEAEDVDVGNIVYFPPQNSFDLGMIKKEDTGEYYLMTTADRIDGIKVKDVREG